jgi:hypothetical protein
MDRELIRKILFFTEQQGSRGWGAGNAGIPEQFASVGWGVLDEHLGTAWKEGFISGSRTSSGWFVTGLKLKAYEFLDNEPTSAQVLQELVETYRKSSESAEALAKEANKIARGANKLAGWAILATIGCALLALPSFLSSVESVSFWIRSFFK